MPLRFCANLSMMFAEKSVSLIDRYSLAAKAGFKGVECAFPYDFSAEELAKARGDLQQVLINVFPGDSLGFAASTGKEEEFKESLKKSLAYCKALNCKRLHIMSGKAEGSEATLRKNLKSAVPLLEEFGVIGLIEPINSYSVPGYFLNDFDLAAEIVKDLNSSNLRLQLDLFHLQFLKGDLTNGIEKYLPLTGHIQLAQVPHRHEPDVPGEIHYPYVLGLLERHQYDGWIGLEYSPKGDTEEGLRWIKAMGYSL